MARSLAYDPRYALNAICPYYTMFPLEYPLRVLNAYRKSHPVVLDPFCGRGTTIYAARHLGMSAWGIDTSPVAVAIARAKLASASLEETTGFIDKLLAKGPNCVPETAFFRSAFSKDTLLEVCSLREGLLRVKKDTDVSIIVRAAALGCLHGPRNETMESAAYFSNQMPRTFSTKPDYSLRFWKERALRAPNVRAKDVLIRKLERVLALNVAQRGIPKQIVYGDAAEPATYTKIAKDFSVVITSPPYYGMRTYIQDQWLRMWFLGGPEDINYVADEQLSRNGRDSFVAALARVWRNVYRSKADDLHIHLRFGSVPSIQSDPKIIVHSSLEEAGGWKVISTKTARDAHAGKRQADQMTKESKAAEEYDFHILRAA